MTCPAMRDGLRFMPEGSGEFEVAEHAGDSEVVVVVWAVRNGLLDEWRRGLLLRLAAGARCGEAAPQLGDDNDHAAYTFIEPSVGYRMEKGGGAGGGRRSLEVDASIRERCRYSVASMMTRPPVRT